jgi:subtilisin-like proprotein convertase family protein
MTVTLISPAGTQVQLVAQPCTSVALADVTATFDDAGIPIVCGNSPAISGVVAPVQSLAAFNGQTMNGTWTLRVLDSFAADGGFINSWSLNLCSTAPALGVAQNSFENFALYPNPNNGTFTLQFNSTTSTPISIGVHDMRGREVYTKFYQNNGFFNENIQLNSLLAGVYLVNIQDGESKIVKKIVIR